MTRAGAPALLSVFLLAGGSASAQRVPFGGVAHTTEHFELIKRVGVAQRSVIHPDATYDENTRRLQESEALWGLEQLGAGLGGFFAELRSERSAYPLLRDVILDYDYLQPRDQSAKNGRMYIMYIGELRWPFPAPLLADLLRVRVVNPLPQPLSDLLTVALSRWGRDNIDRARDRTEAEERQRIAELIAELESPRIAEVQWKRDRTVNQLVASHLDGTGVSRLCAAVQSASDDVRAAALEVLGRGGWVDEPRFFADLLEDRDAAVRRGAFWGLMFMRADRGLEALRTYHGRVEVIAARLREARAAPTAEQIVAEIEAFDQAIGAEPLPKAVLDMLPGAGATPSILRAAQGAVPTPVGSGLPGIVPKAVLPDDTVTIGEEEQPPALEGEPAEPVVDVFPP
jgi:hypothetical protein